MQDNLETWSRRLSGATQYLAIMGGVCLMAIVAVVTSGVVMRYVFGAPLLGINEVVQLTAVALVMSSLPYCTANEDHVAVDVFETWIGKWGRLIGDILSRILSGLVLGVLCNRAASWAMEALEFGDATNMLQMPIWPFYAILAAGAGLCVVIFALQIVHLLIRGAQ
jgi:TRAP-type C4-dicarboxylate transport system permease small subunit